MFPFRLLVALMVLSTWGLLGCHSSADPPDHDAASQEEGQVIGDKSVTPKIDWTRASDCQAKLALLQRGMADGSIVTLETTPFTVISDPTRPNAARWSGFGRSDQSALNDGAKRCVIRTGRARDHQAEHRVLGREQVRSSYQSGSRSEKNPAYEAAQARLRQAERANKPGKSSIIAVGDPLIDLVGTLVGGALTGIGQWGAGDQVEEAIDALTATPRSIEQPVYRPYQFERTRVRASREATMPLIMTDRQSRQSWRLALKRREVRDLSVIEGLDRQDRHYADHRENSMTDQEFRQWQAEPPALPVDDMIASLLDAALTSSIDRVAGLDQRNHEQATVSADTMMDAAMDAAALPGTSFRRSTLSAGQSTLGPAGVRTGSFSTGSFSNGRTTAHESLVDIVAPDHQEKGVYIAPTFILTRSELVEGLGLVDVKDAHGANVLGLVASIDRGLGLALVQVPRPGPPVRLGPGGSFRPSNQANRRLYDRQTPSIEGWGGGVSAGKETVGRRGEGERAESGPILDGDRLLGFRLRHGADITIGDIEKFLTEQRKVLITEG